MAEEKRTRKVRSIEERKEANLQKIQYHENRIFNLEQEKFKIDEIINHHKDSIKNLKEKNDRIDNPVKAPRKKRIGAKTRFTLEEIAKNFGCSLEEAKEKMTVLEELGKE